MNATPSKVCRSCGRSTADILGVRSGRPATLNARGICQACVEAAREARADDLAKAKAALVSLDDICATCRRRRAEHIGRAFQNCPLSRTVKPGARFVLVDDVVVTKGGAR